MKYVELQVTTNFSFLRGASHPHELFEEAAKMGLPALGIVDRNSLAGIIRAHEAAKEFGVRLIVGCRLDLSDGLSILVYPTNKSAYSRLCRLLTIGKRRAGKGKCDLTWDDVVTHNDGLIAILLPDIANEQLQMSLQKLKVVFGNRAYMALTLRRRPQDAMRLYQLNDMAFRSKVPTVATNDILFHTPERRILQDVLSCVRERKTIDDVGYKRERFADRHLKPPEEMARLFRSYPEAIQRSHEIAHRCNFSVDELRYQYPKEIGAGGIPSQESLEKQTWEGARSRYPSGIPPKIESQLQHELDLIKTLEYAPYFLTVNSIVRFARSKGILCQGRGSAANSAVCYVLGVTSIDPERSDLLFERFISLERREPPDIDVDFEHDRREEVIQWIYETYGRDRSALTAVVSRYRSKGALRDVGKALGLSEDVLKMISSHAWGSGKDILSDKRAQSFVNLEDRRIRLTVALAQELYNFPRHLSQHPGGFVLTNDRLDDLVPIEPAAMENRQIIEWDKDDIDVLKFMKVDVLGLGMLSCLGYALKLLNTHKGTNLELATIPSEDKATYDMISKADTIGVFQIESRAQMTMLPRIRPKTFYDLVIEVAIVRPGPIQGDMVHPYLRRREGIEHPQYPTPELKKVLEKTLGVPLFQEQAMSIAIVCAGFTPGEADQLRRAMATFKMTGGVSKFKDKLINGMTARGYDKQFAEKTFSQIEGFGSYGFPESHAASFAILAYASSWFKCHHADVFCCALMNAYPMGFYGPAQLVQDARLHGFEARAIDINHSQWACTLEPTTDLNKFAIRIGFKFVKGLSEDDIKQLVRQRGDRPFESIEEAKVRAGVPNEALEHLANADAFGSLNLSRRTSLWGLKGQADGRLPLFAVIDKRSTEIVAEVNEPHVKLESMTSAMEVTADYASAGLSLKSHPLAFLRSKLDLKRVVRAGDLKNHKSKYVIDVAGIVLVRQRPMTSSGVIFMTIEDETGNANLIIWPKLFEQQRGEVMTAQMIVCNGIVQNENGVIHLIAKKLIPMSNYLPEEKVFFDDLRSEGDYIVKNFEGRSRDFH